MDESGDQQTRGAQVPNDQRDGRFNRRALLGAAGVGLASGYAVGALTSDRERPVRTGTTVPFYGRHQAGITTPPPEHVSVAAFDLDSDDANALRELLIQWTAVAAHLTTGRNPGSNLLHGTPDPGETDDFGATSLTMTFGLGPSLFQVDGDNRMGLAERMPSALRPLPYFTGDVLDGRRSNGDLCVQACADNPQVTFHAIHALSLAAAGAATLRWAQAGFRGATKSGERDPRNLMGFRDGTANVDTSNASAMDRSVWVAASDQPTWMRHGSYLVIRRIRMLMDSWDALSAEGQENAVGRDKKRGTPLGGEHKNDRPDFSARDQGRLAIPENAHIRLAAPSSKSEPPPLRRSYSFADGTDPTTGHIDAGLIFIAFQRDPHRQFVPIQQRLAAQDALHDHLQHTASAVFACPSGTQPQRYIGDRLFA